MPPRRDLPPPSPWIQYAPPRRLVAGAVRRLCAAIAVNRPPAPVKFVLMNTAGNRDLGERVSLVELCVLALLRLLVPPVADNEQAAAFLRTRVGRNDLY